MSKSFKIGVKIYSADWFLNYKLSYKEAARYLRSWGIDFVLVQSRLLPMPDSAVKSEVDADEAARYATFDDRKFRDALAKEGIEYWATVCAFFAPPEIEKNPALRPIGSDGLPMEKFDWYIGIAPTADDFVKKQISAIENAVCILEPDGVFMSFTRWPGFWELWTPEKMPKDFSEYSFDPHTLKRFARENKIELPDGSAKKIALWIEENANDIWIKWKSQIIRDILLQVKKASQAIKPDTKIMLNTLPFGKEDFDNAREEVFGQDVELLSEVVDVFEVMTYHQILRQPTSWIPETGIEVKTRTKSETFCTLQTAPLYLEDIYAEGKRATSLNYEEFEVAIKGVKDAGIDGVVLFTWSELLYKAIVEKDERWEKLLCAMAQ